MPTGRCVYSNSPSIRQNITDILLSAVCELIRAYRRRNTCVRLCPRTCDSCQRLLLKSLTRKVSYFLPSDYIPYVIFVCVSSKVIHWDACFPHKDPRVIEPYRGRQRQHSHFKLNGKLVREHGRSLIIVSQERIPRLLHNHT
jgi:hypothetical protein